MRIVHRDFFFLTEVSRNGPMCTSTLISWSHKQSDLVHWWAQSKEFGVSVGLPRLLVEAVELFGAAEGQQPFDFLVRGQVAKVKVRGGQ